ncbi:Predicted DNA-binding transcriptional regulator YafY, contains an HTH and WYL domains [Flagellimonas zhangzhouensis]|uniref:Predicted DNA-binding transcriptional regulator YafY, contains an HTH and WYL domains n=2 Tax=Flagellimonas zhangzhouensis TaxID=1073328 RepID=A0A1H2RGT0_9FLAO|nr:Predicted DNA-binding transcriptional regulator YafY, contains an HTH and WYL domains [Allomuricauda zhangzhouensis]SDW18703.1 Predicted DNA-binding transcriptional regulator YafY, contains an HTH and WYL domains [Allomuricauda zhangzhouensis]
MSWKTPPILGLKSYLWEIAHAIMGMDTVKRFDRIVAILIQLQTKRIIKAQELADRFDVSLRTIYRDIRTLEASGVPIVSEAGIGYSIMEGYRLPPVMFTREEAGSFVAAEKLMQQFTDKSLGSYYESAMFKLKSVLRGSEKDWVEALESQVSIISGQVLFNDEVPNALEILFESIAERKQVFLRYESLREENPSERSIEPVGLFNENGYWYILGYCHLRTDYRHFRTDRIQQITRTSKDFMLEHGTMDEHRSKKEAVAKTKVKIVVDKTVSKYIHGQTRHYGLISEEVKGKEVEMTFMTDDWKNGFARWFIMFGDYAKIIEPDFLKERVAEILTKSQEMLSN